MSDHKGCFHAGLAVGAVMTDIEILRFYNGIIAAIYECPVKPTPDPSIARRGLMGIMDMLKREENCLAFVGHNGTPIIKPAS